MLEILSLEQKYDTFVIDSQAGLTGKTVIAQYPCVLAGANFFVQIGTTDSSMFGKTTLMNLANFAEKKGAQDMYLILDKEHVQLKQYKRMFKVIDAERVTSADLQGLIRKDAVAKELDLAFYKINL
jgi:hypothetical protein